MMKKIFITILIATLLASCNSFLDITPDGQQKRDEMLQTEEGIEDAMYGVYATLRDGSLYGRELSIASLEVMAQTLFVEDGKGITALSEYNYKYSNVEDQFEATWTKMYQNISNVNSVLNCEKVKSANAYPYILYKGEALGLRAFMHFDLVRLFAKQYTLDSKADGIPYATEFSLNTPAFESLEANYQHILADLHEAEQLLTEAQTALISDKRNYVSDQQIHFNLSAVQATLARVYLAMGNHEQSLRYAQKVISESGRVLSGKTEISGDVAGKLSPKETIFGVYYSGFYAVVSGTLQKMTSFYSLNPREDVEDVYASYGTNFDPAHRLTIAGQDYRLSAYFSYEDNGGNSVRRLCKLTDPYEKNSTTSKRPSADVLGINMIRLPEMYLVASECLLALGRSAEATTLFDTLLSSRGITPLSDPLVGETLTQDYINHEFYKEYIGEGQIWFNFKRQNQDILSYDGLTTIPASDDIYVIPIPEIEKEYRY